MNCSGVVILPGDYYPLSHQILKAHATIYLEESGMAGCCFLLQFIMLAKSTRRDLCKPGIELNHEYPFAWHFSSLLSSSVSSITRSWTYAGFCGNIVPASVSR